MAARPPDRPLSMVGQRQPNRIAQALWIVLLVCVAYLFAAFLHGVLAAISLTPSGLFADPAIQGPLFYALMIIVVGAFFVPVFHDEWDGRLRAFSAFVVIFLIAYTLLHNGGPIDPDLPIKYLNAHVVYPFRKAVGF